MLADMRCPRCNWPVYGREEVRVVKRPVKAQATCQKCGCKVVRVDGERLGEKASSYEAAKA